MNQIRRSLLSFFGLGMLAAWMKPASAKGHQMSKKEMEVISVTTRLPPADQNPAHVQRIAAIEMAPSEQDYLANEGHWRREAAARLLEDLLDLDLIKFDTSKMVTLCGCDLVGYPKDKHNPLCGNAHPPTLGVRAIITVAISQPELDTIRKNRFGR